MNDELKVKNLSKTDRRAIVLEALRKEGYNDSEAAQLMLVTRSRVNQVSNKIKSGSLNSLAARAKKSVKSILKGELVGKMEKVTGAEILSAAKLVLDRVDPVTVKTENTNISMSYQLLPEDRERYRTLLGAKVIDAEFSVLPNEQKLLEEKNEKEESEEEES